MNTEQFKRYLKTRSLVKLNLGCGRKKRKDCINIDYAPVMADGKRPDYVMNLLKFPYPMPNNSVDEIYIEHTLEHFQKEDIYRIFEEFYRICKPNALIKVKVPYFSNPVAFTDWDHKTRFGRDSFKRLAVTKGGTRNKGNQPYIMKKRWQLEEVYNHLHPTLFGRFIPTQKLKWLFSIFFWSIVFEMESHLKVIK